MIKVAVHNQAFVTLNDNLAPNWRRWHVYAGLDPEGPRGGRQGRIMNGKWVAGPYRSAAEAQAKAEEYAVEKGYELI